MRNYFFQLLCLCAICVALLYYLAPKDSAYIEAEIAALDPQQALDHLNASNYDFETHPRLVWRHAVLASAAGQLDKAELLLRQISRAQTGVEGPALLIKNHMSRGDYVAALGALKQANPKPAEIQDADLPQRLLARLARDQEAEIAAFAAQSGPAQSAWALDRQARLLLAQNDMQALEALYLDAIAQDGPARKLAQERLVVYYLDHQAEQDAIALGLGIWSARGDTQEIAEILRLFLRYRAHDALTGLADSLAKTAAPNRLYLVSFFTQERAFLYAARYLQMVLNHQDPITPLGVEILARHAMLSGDLFAIKHVLGREDVVMDTEHLAAALMPILRYEGGHGLFAFRDLGSDALTAEAPLLGAALALEQGQVEEAIAGLEAAAKQDLGVWDKRIWLALAGRINGSALHRQAMMFEQELEVEEGR